MQLKKIALSVAAVAALGACGSAGAYTNHEEQIIVHPFSWTYDMIADECEEVLGPNGFDGVQIQQPAEHLDVRNVWWSLYKPVNFNNFTTMLGNEKQLRSMIQRCNKAGVRVYVDAVFNQRSDFLKDESGKVVVSWGTAGSRFNPDTFEYPDMDRSDFNDNRCAIDYTNLWSVWNCALSGMPDLNVENESTQQKVANYLQKLLNMGVYGFRIDAAKHMSPKGISGILSKVGNPFTYMEVIGAQGEAVQPTMYTDIPNTVVTEFRYCPTLQNNIQKPSVLLDMNDKWFDITSDGAETFIVNHDNERGSAGTTYLNYKNSPRYSIAQSFLVAWPFGKVRQVYSGYKFDYHDQGAPFSDPRCTGGWNCDHRVSVVQNAVGFARATRGYGVYYKGASSDGKVIWFTRGDKGFYVMNSSDEPIKWTFDTHMPDGQYCEILQQPGKCDGQQITVKNGKAEIMVYDKSAAAICIDDSNKGFCGQCEDKDHDGRCDVVPPSNDLYFAGTTNGWTFSKFDKNEDGSWSLNLELTGEGDKNGAQRFKITNAADWKHKVYGAGPDHTLCDDEVKCPDIEVSNKGSSTIIITPDLKWNIKTVEVNHKPVAQFSTSVDGLAVQFTNESTDEDNDQLNVTWNFDDGTDSTEDNPVHAYTQAGTYNVTLTVTDGHSEPVSTTQSVTVTDEPEPTCKKTVDALYFAGTTNGWKHSAMTFNSEICKWTIDLNLTGAGDNNGSQRFKVTTAPNWNADVYGTAGGNKLCNNQAGCGDVIISQQGQYTLSVDDKELTWELTRIGGTYIPATRDAMYFAGTANKWGHSAMKYNSATGNWEITLNLTGAGDSNGSQRFKITSAPNWYGTVWGDAGGNNLCSNQAICGDVFINEVGTYVLKVNDKNLTWELVAQ